ncbi:MAG: glycosyltransferase [Candidatus Eisenbacteria bacterium]
MDRTGTTVSVVMPTYRKKGLLAETLSALRAQSYPHERIEVVVVDDCSGDDTWEFLKSLETPFSLVPVRHDVNRGRATARNSAIRKAEGDLVLFLDDDMRADARLVEEHVGCHAAHADSVVIGNALTAPELGASNVLRYLDTRGVHKLGAGADVPARYFLTNNASLPREALLAVGLFDETFRNYGFEDTELAFRLERDAGLRFRYCPEALAYHIHHHSLRQLVDKRYESARGSLGHLLDRHPDRGRELKVDALLPPGEADGGLLRARKLLTRAVTSRPATAIATALAGGPFLGPVTFRAIDLLIAAAYRRGLADSVRAGS